MFRLISHLVVTLVLLVAASSTTADSQKFSVWKSQKLGVRFTYSDLWIRSTPIQDTTVFKINWLAESGGLIASCHVKAASSELGRLPPAQIHEKADEIGRSILANIRKWDPEASMHKVEPLLQDNHPVVYMESTATVANIEFTSQFDMYDIVTAWRGKEVFSHVDLLLLRNGKN